MHFDVAFEQFHLFPNPVSEQLAVDLADLGKVDCRLRIFDALGQEVYQVDAPADSGQVLFIDTRTFAPGVYTLSVTSQSMARQAKKFVVVRR
ncbi:MAG TPA: T9SS type A sorting domain-containing protein [Phaeodactylibacter sp.]|nr:T9SS type A sorting domain-containing protein [Phaeodactylibacter sp.]